jgi:hypothetical protein
MNLNSFALGGQIMPGSTPYIHFGNLEGSTKDKTKKLSGVIIPNKV